MLSATHEITDIKKELEDCEFYGYATDDDFDEILTDVIDTVRREHMLPLISSTTYEELAAKDRIDLDDDEENIYWGEVNYVRSEFLMQRSRKLRARQHAAAEEVTDQSVGVALDFVVKAREALYLAGYRVGTRLSRYGTVKDTNINASGNATDSRK